MRNIKLTIEYDGTNYHGWQIQKNRPTVQSTIVQAVYAITNERVTLYGSGRTDSGVHAAGQVANLHLKKSFPIHSFAKALNAHLPDDIVIHQAEIVPDTFHAQYSASGKIYQYVIWNAPTASALRRQYSYHVRETLSTAKMRAGAKLLIGTHDFRSFCRQSHTQKNTVRTINSLTISKRESMLTLQFDGNGFLYNMVRAIVGTLIAVGHGTISDQDMKAILKAKDRSKGGTNAPARGLTLLKVYYKAIKNV